jgi:hypothetical protein
MHRRLPSLAAAAAAVVSLVAVAPAAADTAAITFTDAAGNNDPVAGVGRTLAISGNTASSKRIYVKYRAPGGAACAPSAASDSGDNDELAYDFDSEDYYGQTVNGNFDLRSTGVWDEPGAVMFCIWLAASSDDPVTPISQVVTFRAATGSISASIAPATPEPGQDAAVTITGASEAPARVYATVRPAGGAACAATYSADSGTGIVDGESVNGSFSVQGTMRLEDAGQYQLCLWLADSSDDSSPTSGPQAVAFTVGSAPTPVPESIPTVSQPTKYASSVSLRRRGARYSGRVTSGEGCVGGRTVRLRRGSRTIATTRTRYNGTFTIQLSRKVRGRAYVSVSPRANSSVRCTATRSSSVSR